MFIEKKHLAKNNLSLRERFLKTLTKEIKIGVYKGDNLVLRETLKKRLSKGELF
jgi:hypothetical protein